MANNELVEELVLTESDDAALSLVHADLKEASDYKRDNWNPEHIRNRWAAFHGDPAIQDWTFRGANGQTATKPVHNLIFIQLRHKVGKLTRPATRLNVTTRTQEPTPEVRFALAIAKKRLEQKAKEANWRSKRRTMARDAGVQGMGIRAVGVQYLGVKPKVRCWRVRQPEWYFDPAAEPDDLLGTASWVAWRRYVAADKLADTLRKYDVPAGHGGADFDAEGDNGITLPDDQILLRGDFTRERSWMPQNRVLVTDYYRRDDTMDVYYPCSKCGRQATVGRYITQRSVRPLLQCQHCDHMEKTMPARENMRQGPRYPYGRHVRILGPGVVVYNGPCKLELEDIFPFVCMPWYEDETPSGMSEVEVLWSDQQSHNLAEAMLEDNAIFNTHPKRWALQGSIVKPDNNDPSNIIEMSEQGVAVGQGLHQLPPGGAGEAAKILLEKSRANAYESAGNDPVSHGAQPDTLRSGVGVGRVVAAGEVSLYLNQDVFYEAETRFYRLVRDICRKVDYPQEMFARNEATGVTQPAMYDRMLMYLISDIEVTTEQQVDQQREEHFSRAIQLKGVGDPYVTWDMLHELSGIPEDMWARARQELENSPFPMGQRPIDQIVPGASPGAQQPALSVIPGGRPPQPVPGGGGGAGMTGPGRLRQEVAGQNAPPQHRPPSRSRGMQTPTSPAGGGGF